MKILLVNPPNCGRSIPEEQYGIDSIKQIFRGEPLALEVLAGGLDGHDVMIVDLKAGPGMLMDAFADFNPDIVGLTGLTCEANSVVRIAGELKETRDVTVVAGGVHASNSPEFYNRPEIDFVAVGLGKKSFGELVSALEKGHVDVAIPGVAKTSPGSALSFVPRKYSGEDLMESLPPRYDLVSQYRDTYVLSTLGFKIGFVVTAYGCPFSCSFCSITKLTDRRYLTHNHESVLRDIRLLGDIPVIRLVDALTFGNPPAALKLCEEIMDAGISKHFIVDVRSDTVVRNPDLFRRWREAGLRSVVIGFEEVQDEGLNAMNKGTSVDTNVRAIDILHEIGITIVGDFIISPDYTEEDFERLGSFITDNSIDLPMPTVLTPLPGTPLHEAMKDSIVVHDLDYYTLTNAVTPTRLDEKTFYKLYARLLESSHSGAKL
jgi:radical SAM superfamily enzyme YgiQ (UPF0313 family)